MRKSLFLPAVIISSFAAGVSGMIGAMQVAGRVVFAPVESRFSGRSVAVGLFLLLGIALLIILFVPSIVGALLFVVIFGATYGAMTLVRPVIVADYYGPAQYGRISSIMALFLTSAVASPVIVGFFYDRFEQYEPIIAVLIVCTLISVGAMLKARSPQTTESQNAHLLRQPAVSPAPQPTD